MFPRPTARPRDERKNSQWLPHSPRSLAAAGSASWVTTSTWEESPGLNQLEEIGLGFGCVALGALLVGLIVVSIIYLLIRLAI